MLADWVNWAWKICDRPLQVRQRDRALLCTQPQQKYGNQIGKALSAQSGITYKVVV
ncbi:MAG: hypothetical protein F6K28_15000 [Microcoleus sp. SIO2G3]|nr:hypothetical protein [Microcoleus sp. SIO2G3]